jgi:DnaJ-class molecular chaperone
MVISGGRGRTVSAMCSCGAVLCWAEAVFVSCSECDGTGVGRSKGPCLRCGGSGEVVDHTALEWQRAGRETKGAAW